MSDNGNQLVAFLIGVILGAVWGLVWPCCLHPKPVKHCAIKFRAVPQPTGRRPKLNWIK